MKVRKGLDPSQIIPAVLIIKLNKENNTSEIRFMIEGQNLLDEEGDYYFRFLQNANQDLNQEL